MWRLGGGGWGLGVVVVVVAEEGGLDLKGRGGVSWGLRKGGGGVGG